MKKILLLPILMITLLTSCKEEFCPEPFCTMTFNFSVPRLEGRTTLPVDKLALFLLDENKGHRIGPIYIDLGNAADIAKHINGIYYFNVKQALPYGDYKMWIWGNVEDESVASFDWLSLNMKNNYAGNDYLLCKAKNVSLYERNMTSTEVLERVTAQINFTVNGSENEGYNGGVTLYGEPLYTRVNAYLEYSLDALNNRVDFETGATDVPPAHVYVFPTINQAQTQFHFTYSYGDPESRGSDSQSLTIERAGDYNVVFEAAEVVVP